MPRPLRASALEFVKTLRYARGTKSRRVSVAAATPPANGEEETDHCSKESKDLATGSGILVNVTELAVNTTFYKRSVERGEVRILTIHPGHYSDTLSCKLQEYDIRQVPEYTAISYCWTYDAELVNICVDDNGTFKVPVHLRACLRRLRSATSAISVWIDAICINQNDQVEKSEQVGQMPKIYSGSLRTVIWLGETEPSAPTCIVRANGYCAIEGFSSVEHGNMLQLLDHFVEDAERASLKPEARYLMRVWWKRLWCIQEFMLSPRVPKVMAGPHLVRWHDFLTLAEYNVSPLFKGHNNLGHPSSVDPSSLDHDPEHWQGPSRRKSLLELLRITYKDFACSDPRDRIFALIGITDDAQVTIQVDYERTVEEFYSEATAYLINADGNVDMLLDARVFRRNDALPTWVPQFASIKTTKEASTFDAFRASSEKPVAAIIYREPSIPCGCTGSCLKLKAVKFDKIVRRVAVIAEYGTPDWEGESLTPSRGDERTYHFEVVSSGANSDRFDHSLRNEVKRKRSRFPRFYQDLCLEDPQTILDWILQALAIDYTQPPLLRLERLPQIGLLFSDYLFNGTQSLEKVMKYYHDPNATRRRDWYPTSCFDFRRQDPARMPLHWERTWVRDWSLAQTGLVQRHRLSERQACLRDLEVAMELQFNVLSKIAKVTIKPDRDSTGNAIPESTFSPDSGYERVFFKTEDQHLGVGPGDLQEGDEVVVPFGSSRPWVLRSHGDHHVLVGEAFVPGIMTGQLEELWRRGDLEYTDYVLR